MMATLAFNKLKLVLISTSELKQSRYWLEKPSGFFSVGSVKYGKLSGTFSHSDYSLNNIFRISSELPKIYGLFSRYSSLL